MAEGDAPEGWHVPQRRALLIAALVPLLVGLAVWGAARLYDSRLRPRMDRSVTTFPAPGIETFVHDGKGDPERPDRHPPRDPAIEAAKAAVVADDGPTRAVAR